MISSKDVPQSGTVPVAPAPWIRRRRAELSLGVRITAASLLSFALCHLLSLPQSYPAVLTAVIVMQASVGASLKAMLDRFQGSLGGAIWGVAVVLAIPHSTSGSLGLALAIAVTPLGLIAALKPAYRAAPITAVILLLTPGSVDGPFVSAFQRILEIGIGSIVALVVALVVLPARAHVALAQAAGRAAKKMGDLAAVLLQDLSAQTDAGVIQALHDDIRKALSQAETAGDEAQRERATYLAGGPDPLPLCRTLRRLRNDLAMVGRALAEPLPDPAGTVLADSTAEAGAAVAAFLRETGAAIADRKPAPTLEQVGATHARQAAAVAQLRRSGETLRLPDETVGRVFGLAFSLEQLHHNLDDLSDRVNELASGGNSEAPSLLPAEKYPSTPTRPR